MVTSIGLVNRLHRSGEAGDFLPLDYRINAPDHDEQTKKEHFLAMFDQVISDNKVLASNILFLLLVRGQHEFEVHSPHGLDLFHNPEK